MVRARRERPHAVAVKVAVAAVLAVSGGMTVPGVAGAAPARAFEKVSATDKGFVDVVKRSGARSASPSGDQIVYNLYGPAPDAESGGGTLIYSTRDPDRGWTQMSLDPPSTTGTYPKYLAFSDDLSQGILEAYAPLDPEAAPGRSSVYTRSLKPSIGPFQLITPGPGAAGFFDSSLVDNVNWSSDQVVFETGRLLTDDTPTGGLGFPFNAFERKDGALRLVGVLPNKTIAPQGALVGSGLIGAGTTQRALSKDGRRIVFHTLDGSTKEGAIYVREDGSSTLHASASVRTDCADDPNNCTGVASPDPLGPAAATYWSAEAEHGASVLFSSCEKLTNDSTASVSPSCVGGENDLYRYDVDTQALTDLTVSDKSGARFLGVLGTSEALDRIYFAARGVLAPGGQAGQPNLYMWTPEGTTYIATLGETLIDQSNWSASDVLRRGVTRTTPDGRFLAFTSRSSLDSANNGAAACESGACSVVYLFDSKSAEVTCVSCRTIAGPAQGDSRLTTPGINSGDPFARNLAEDGSHLFFDSDDALVAGDTNGTGDVYEWRAGAGLSLVSDGHGENASRFADATPNGSDVFFTTRQRLVDADRDTLVDMYDARVGGGFPDAPPAPPVCREDTCQGLPGTTPPLQSPATSTTGDRDGNLRPSPRVTVGIRSITASMRKRLVAGGVGSIRVKTNSRAKVHLSVRGIKPASRRAAIPVAGVKRKAGVVTIRMRLPDRLRRQVKARGSVTIELTVRIAAAETTRRVALKAGR